MFLVRKIDSFIRDRILLADRVIEQHAIAKIKDGETILTYARSSVVEGVLLEAKRQGKVFTVVVVDSRPLYEGESMVRLLNFLKRLVLIRLNCSLYRQEPTSSTDSSIDSDYLRPSPFSLSRPSSRVALSSGHARATLEWIDVLARWNGDGGHDAHSAGSTCRMLLRDVQVQ